MSAPYEQRAAEYAERRAAEWRRSAVIARLRLATFIPGAVCLAWAVGRGGPAALVVAGTALLAAFAVLVVWHARVDERAAWFDALHVVNRRALARIARAWDLLPPADPAQALHLHEAREPGESIPPPADLEHHPYAIDLDLFGRASLLQWLGPAATPAGAGMLQTWLLRPASATQVVDRQLAVLSLAPAIDWRERLGAYGKLAEGVRVGDLNRFVAWAEGPGPFTGARLRSFRLAVLLLAGAIWALIVLQAAGAIAGAYWLLPMLAGIVLSYATAREVHAQFDRAGAGQYAFARYAALLAHAAAMPGHAPHLAAIRDQLAASGSPAPECMRRLNRIIGFAQLRSSAGILHFVIQAATLWDLHVFFALDRWRTRVGPAVRGWIQALGELDALSALAQAKFDNPSWCMPEISGGPAVLEARNLGHPLIPDARRIGNDVTVGPPATLLLITGSNMSGKSTLLRAIGLNVVLAQAGAPVCAASLRLPPADLETSIRVQDSLEQGLSYFMAALARLKALVDRARAHTGGDGRIVLYLLDEILQGTNTAERAIAVRGIARHLLSCNAIGVMTTHDLGLAAEDPLNTAARLAHFSETVDENGVMSFDYRLRPGLATSRNALRLMRLIGLDLQG